MLAVRSLTLLLQDPFDTDYQRLGPVRPFEGVSVVWRREVSQPGQPFL